MAIKPRFTKADFNRILDERMRRIHAAIINRLKYLGEMCLTEMRTNKTYKDQTGNLTSSMGYVVVDHGTVVQAAGFEGKQEGSSTGRGLAESLAGLNKNTFALYVVAGMNYAAYVEAKGYNVLTSAELLAERELPNMMRQIIDNIKNMK